MPLSGVSRCPGAGSRARPAKTTIGSSSPRTLSTLLGQFLGDRHRAASGGPYVRRAARGLTGGSGSGKSTVAALLRPRGAVDRRRRRDRARRWSSPGSPRFAALVERFGSGDPRGPTAASTAPRSRRVAFADRGAPPGPRGDHPPGDRRRVPARACRPRPADAIVVSDVPLLVESSRPGRAGYEVVIVVEAPARRCASTGSRSGASPATTPRRAWRPRPPTRSAGRSRPTSSTTAATRATSRPRSTTLWADLERLARRAGAGDREQE